MEQKVTLTTDVVNGILKDWNDRDLEPDIALAAGGQLFARICNDCNLSGEQFLFLCKGIAEKMKWENIDSENSSKEDK